MHAFGPWNWLASLEMDQTIQGIVSKYDSIPDEECDIICANCKPCSCAHLEHEPLCAEESVEELCCHSQNACQVFQHTHTLWPYRHPVFAHTNPIMSCAWFETLHLYRHLTQGVLHQEHTVICALAMIGLCFMNCLHTSSRVSLRYG